jgi:hypothetical protein
MEVQTTAIHVESMSEEEASKQFPPQPDEDIYDWATVQEPITFRANEFSEGHGVAELRGRMFRIRQRGWLICYIPQQK